MKKIKTVKSVTLSKKIKTINLVTSAKNIVSVPIKTIFARISIPIKSVCDSYSVESNLVKSVKSIGNSFPFNMISDFAYLLALMFLFLKLVKKLLIIRN